MRRIIVSLQSISSKDAFELVSVLVMEPSLYAFSVEYFSECVDLLLSFVKTTTTTTTTSTTAVISESISVEPSDGSGNDKKNQE